MAKITMTGGQLYILTPFFLGLENKDLKFSIRRRLIRLNEKMKIEYDAVREEILKIMKEYCDKDSDGNPIVTDDRYTFTQGQLNDVNTKMFEVESSIIELEYEEFTLDEKYFDDFKCDRSLIELIENYFLEK